MVKKLLSLLEEQPIVAPPELPPLSPDGEHPVFRILSPISDKLSATQATGLMSVLKARSTSQFLSLSIRGTREGVRWELFLSDFEKEVDEDQLTELFSSYYPGTIAERVKMSEPAQPLYRRYHIFKPKAALYFNQALSVNDIRLDDPLIAVAKAVAELGDGETLTYTISLVNVFTPDQKELKRILTTSAWKAGWRPQAGPIPMRSVGAAAGGIVGNGIGMGIRSLQLMLRRVDQFSAADTERFLQKLKQELAGCIVSVTFDSPNKDRLQFLERVYGAVQALSNDEIQVVGGYTCPVLPITNFHDWFFKTPAFELAKVATSNSGNSNKVNQYLFILTDDELAAFWHLPHSGFPADILATSVVHVAVPRNLKTGTDGVKIGVNRVGSRTTDIYLTMNDRTSHTSISGKTGGGKTSFIHWLVHQDIAAGLGVCV